MGCDPPGSSVHGILQIRILEWVAFCYGIGRVKEDPLLFWGPSRTSVLGKNTKNKVASNFFYPCGPLHRTSDQTQQHPSWKQAKERVSKQDRYNLMQYNYRKDILFVLYSVGWEQVTGHATLKGRELITQGHELQEGWTIRDHLGIFNLNHLNNRQRQGGSPGLLKCITGESRSYSAYLHTYIYACISVCLVSLSDYHLSFYLENHGLCSHVQFQSNTTMSFLALSLSIFVTPFSNVRNLHRFIYLISSVGSPPPLPLMDAFLSAQAPTRSQKDDLVIVFTLWHTRGAALSVDAPTLTGSDPPIRFPPGTEVLFT